MDTATTITTSGKRREMWLLESLAAIVLVWIVIKPLTCRCPRPRK
jgi:hypothetical protein